VGLARENRLFPATTKNNIMRQAGFSKMQYSGIKYFWVFWGGRGNVERSVFWFPTEKKVVKVLNTNIFMHNTNLYVASQAKSLPTTNIIIFGFQGFHFCWTPYSKLAILALPCHSILKLDDMTMK
jgi:hypothetical protein